MKKHTVLLIALFLAASQVAVAQKRKTTKTPQPQLPTITLTEALQQYRFAEAEELLLGQIEELNRNGQSTTTLEEKLHAVEKAKNRLNATEQVVFIDSLVVPKADLFQHLKMSPEVGSLHSYSTFFKQEEKADLSVFLSQMKDKIYYSDQDESGHIRLFTRDKEGDHWSDPSPVRGLEEQDDLHQNYPFVLSDGVTLYFAAQGSESIGGYDIFMTRYDSDDHSFLMPENIGMPFNSPANDYLYMVDDFLNLGWFVTDRNQPADKLCIYTFIPNQTRKVYSTSSISPEQLRSLAKLASIQATWNDKKEVEEARNRMSMISQSQEQVQIDDLQFPVADGVIYHRLEDFKNVEARKKFGFLMEGRKQFNEQEQILENMRTQYAKANASGKETLKPRILQAEAQLSKLIRDLHEQEKEVRRLESESKK